jgi:hypothetical protein
MQYLISRTAVERISRFRSDRALSTANDCHIDGALDAAGLLRLSTAEPVVYHIGNEISEDWLINEHKKLVLGNSVMPKSHVPSRSKHWFWSRAKIKRFFRWLYEWSFSMYYRGD